MDNPNIAFKRKKSKEKGRPTSERLRNLIRNDKTPARPRINIAKVKEVRRRTGADVNESVKALKIKGGSVTAATTYIRHTNNQLKIS
jgi:hypothetical protein